VGSIAAEALVTANPAAKTRATPNRGFMASPFPYYFEFIGSPVERRM
jgi:hypothetical protein